MASTRTPTSGTIMMSDLDKSIVQGWASNTSDQSLQNYATVDFNPGSTPNGFALCYGNPGVGAPHRLSEFYDILGWVDYRATAISLGGGINNITVNINPMNGSNGTPPNPLTLDTGTGTLPSGVNQQEGAHWETLQFVLTVAMGGGSFDVYYDGTYIDTIIMGGVYVYDNGGLGYANAYGTSGYVDILFQ
jgi:hypothetical protein